jgi:3-oxoacyl-[acyl-carrier-protein] synthase-3
MRATVEGVAVRAIACAVPEIAMPIASLADEFGTTDMNRVIANSGIRELRVAPAGVTAADLCQFAASHLLETTGAKPDAVDGIVFVSQTPDYRIPATSAVLQHRLGLPREAVVFDVNHGCVGHVYGLYQAALLIAAGGCRRILVLAGDAVSRLIHPKDRATRVLIGDAGSATLVEAGNGSIAFDLRTDGSRFDALMVPAGGGRLPHSGETSVASEQEGGNWRSPENLFMNGLRITEFALSDVVRLVKDTLAHRSLQVDDVGQFLFHQANGFVIRSMARSLGIPPEKAPLLVERFGNTSSASIPMTLCQKFGSQECSAENVSLQTTMLVGFGVGLCWGTALLDLSTTRILPVKDLP